MKVRGNKKGNREWGLGKEETRRQGDKEGDFLSLLVSPSPCPFASSSHFPLLIPQSLFVLLVLFASALAQDRPTPPLTGRETPPASSPISSKAESSGDRSFRLILPPLSDAGPKSGSVQMT